MEKHSQSGQVLTELAILLIALILAFSIFRQRDWDFKQNPKWQRFEEIRR